MGYWEEKKPIIAMVFVTAAFAITNVLVKKAMDEGMDKLVLITLRYLLVTIFMAPVAYVKERKMKPKLTLEIFGYIFLSAMLGAGCMQYLFIWGMQNTTATYACAIINVAPVLTFLVAIPFRLETVTVKSKAGIAKVLGIVICFAGTLLLTLYKGISLTNTSHQVAESRKHESHSMDNSIRGKWMIGTTALLTCTLGLSAWYLLQPKVAKKFPAHYTGTTVMFFLSFLQAATLSFAIQRDTSLWMVKKKFDIITVMFSGIAGSGFSYLVILWCVEKRGPVFVASFNPLILIMVACIDVSILHEQLHLGSLLGSVLVIAGLYLLLWGKNKETQIAVKPTGVCEEINRPPQNV